MDQIHKILFVDTVVSDRGHRKNIMDPVLEEMGTGIVSGNFQGYNATAGAEDFAYSQYLGGKAFLTGVAYSDAVSHNNFYTVGEGLGHSGEVRRVGGRGGGEFDDAGDAAHEGWSSG